MDALEAIKQRRSVKYYDASHQMTEEEIKTLLEHAILSPTSFNMQNWRFVVVSDAEIKQQLRAVSWNQAQVSDASIVILICADLKSWGKNPERYWKNAPEETRNAIVPMIPKFYDGNTQLERDEAMRSCGIAAQTLMIAAKALGYDSCPMIGFDPNKVASIINLPEDHVIGMMLPIGKAVKPANARAGQLDYNEVVIRDKF
jgi:nitroreductase